MKYKTLAAAVVAAVGFSNVVLAQQPQPPTYRLEGITPAEMQLIGKGLSSLPYGDVWNLIAKLQQQINAQETPVAGAAGAEAPKEKK